MKVANSYWNPAEACFLLFFDFYASPTLNLRPSLRNEKTQVQQFIECCKEICRATDLSVVYALTIGQYLCLEKELSPVAAIGNSSSLAW